MTKFDQDPIGGRLESGSGGHWEGSAGQTTGKRWKVGGPREGRPQPLTGPAESGKGGAWGTAAGTQGLE